MQQFLYGPKGVISAMITTKQLVTRFNMVSHPEGGYYTETYKSKESIKASCLPSRFGGDRVFSTAIYFLLEQGNFSAFHRIKSDECWHFYAGQALLIYIISPDGLLTVTRLGNDISGGEVFQFVVPADCWFASEPASGSAFSFAGCTVAPGFDFADFELATANQLAKEYPVHAQLIKRLCRND